MTLHRGRARRAGSSRVGRGGKFNRIKTCTTWTLEPAAAAARGSSSRSRPSRRCRPTGFMEAFGRRGWFKRRRGKALRRLQSILEEDRDRGARATVGGLCRLRAPMTPPPRIVLAARARRGARRRRLRQQGGDVTSAETEGVYIDVGDLKYQVQISRYLNPARRRGPRVPARPAGRDAQPPGRRDLVRRLHARQEPRPTRRSPIGRRSSRSSTPQGNDVPARSRSTRRPTRSPTSRSTLPPGSVLPTAGHAGRPAARSRARCCSSSSRPTSLAEPPARAAHLEHRTGADQARRRPRRLARSARASRTVPGRRRGGRRRPRPGRRAAPRRRRAGAL